MDKIRVLLSNDPPRSFCESVVDLIRRQIDMEVVGVVSDPLELLLAVGETHAEVVVLNSSSPEEDPGICSHLLAEYRELLILAIPGDSNKAFSYRQVTLKEGLSIESEEEVIAAIRKSRIYLHDQ